MKRLLVCLFAIGLFTIGFTSPVHAEWWHNKALKEKLQLDERQVREMDQIINAYKGKRIENILCLNIPVERGKAENRQCCEGNHSDPLISGYKISEETRHTEHSQWNSPKIPGQSDQIRPEG